MSPRHVGTATHPTYGDTALPVLEMHDGHDRMAVYLVRDTDGHALSIGSIAALAQMGYTVTWNPAPPRRWPTRPEEGGD